MKKQRLLILLIPLLLSGCAKEEQTNQYRTIDDKIVEQYYSQHVDNQPNLSLYESKVVEQYDPTYDSFGALTPSEGTKGLYYENEVATNIGIYSGYFIKSTSTSTYKGNKNNVGSTSKDTEGVSYWFKEYDEEEKELHPNQMELILRTEHMNNTTESTVVDEKTGKAVDNADISKYFSENINAYYSDEFPIKLVQPEVSNITAYLKSDSEIVENSEKTISEMTIENPVHPGVKHRLAVVEQTLTETVFKFIDKIGWVGTSYTETITKSVTTDYELKLLEEPRVIWKKETTVSFTYSESIQPYTGEAFVFQQPDEKVLELTPSMYQFIEDEHILLPYASEEVTFQYQQLHPSFSGHAFLFSSVELVEDGLYSFASKRDVEGEEPDYETIGYSQLNSNINETIVSAKIEGHNLFKTISNAKYEFIVLISPIEVVSLIAHIIK